MSIWKLISIYRYLHPEREKRTTDKALGSHYGKQYLEQIFENSEHVKESANSITDSVTVTDYQREPIMILYYKSQLRLVVDLQTNVKAMQNQAYARKMKVTNLQQMAKTIIYVQENGFNTQEDLKTKLSSESTKLAEAQENLSILTAELKTVNEQIHFTGQYQQHKRIYSDFLKSSNKKNFRQNHSAEITAYEEARRWIKDHLANETLESIASLKDKKVRLQKDIQKEKQFLQSQKELYHDLEVANINISEILNMKCRTKSNEHQL